MGLRRQRRHVDQRAAVTEDVAAQRDVAQPQHLREQQQRRDERASLVNAGKHAAWLVTGVGGVKLGATGLQQLIGVGGSRPVTKSARTVLLVVLGLAGLGCLGASAITWLMMRALDGLGGSTEWSESAVPERELPEIFGVSLPVKPLRYQSRSLGFQDQQFEVLVQLPGGAAEAFLTSNHLVRGEERSLDVDVADQVRVLEPSTPPLRTTTVELPEALRADGGAFNLHRSAELLEAPGVVWLHLLAFET